MITNTIKPTRTALGAQGFLNVIQINKSIVSNDIIPVSVS